MLLRTLCENDADAIRELSSTVAEALKHRLADMRAAKSVMDLVAGQPRQLSGSDHQQMVINLYDDYLMVFTANHNKNPETETGKVDWRKVSRIKIIGIERENGS